MRESSFESSPDIVAQFWDRLTHIGQFLLPPPGVTLFRLGHADENAFAFFVALARGQIAIDLRRLYFRAPIFEDNFDCFFLRRFSHRTDIRGNIEGMPSVVAVQLPPLSWRQKESDLPLETAAATTGDRAPRVARIPLRCLTGFTPGPFQPSSEATARRATSLGMINPLPPMRQEPAALISVLIVAW
jgi:hypothetical protein